MRRGASRSMLSTASTRPAGRVSSPMSVGGRSAPSYGVASHGKASAGASSRYYTSDTDLTSLSASSSGHAGHDDGEEGGATTWKARKMKMYDTALFTLISQVLAYPSPLKSYKYGVVLFLEWLQICSVFVNAEFPWGKASLLRSVDFGFGLATLRLTVIESYDDAVTVFIFTLLFVTLGFAACAALVHNVTAKRWTNIAKLQAGVYWFCLLAVTLLPLPVYQSILTFMACDYSDAASDVHGWQSTGKTSAECLASPNILYIIIGAVYLVAFILLHGGLSAAWFSLKPVATGYSVASTKAALATAAMKLAMAVASTLMYNTPLLRALTLVIATFACLHVHQVTLPFYRTSVNMVQAGYKASYAWLAVCLLAATAINDPSSPDASVLSIVTLSALPLVFVFAWTAVTVRSMKSRSLRRLKESVGENGEAVFSLGRCKREEYVEQAARPGLANGVSPEALDLSISVLQAGVRRFPRSAALYEHLAMYLKYSGREAEAQHAWERATSMKPWIALRCVGFQRAAAIEEERQAQIASGNYGEATLDLVGYIEFQQSSEMLRRLHGDAQRAVQHFWRALKRSDMTPEKLPSVADRVTRTQKRAMAAYQEQLRKHPRNPVLLRQYARFLDEIANDLRGADRANRRADKIENASEGTLDEGDGIGMDGHGADSQEAELNSQTDAVITISNTGVVESVNPQVYQVLGYRRDDLVKKNITRIIPSPFAEAHAQYLENYLESGIPRIIGVARKLWARHRDGSLIRVLMRVTEIQVHGKTTYAALLRGIEDVNGFCMLDSNGVVKGANNTLCTELGYTAAELTGSAVRKYLHPAAGREMVQVMEDYVLVEPGAPNSVMNMPIPMLLVRKDGTSTRVVCTLTRQDMGGFTVFQAVLQLLHPLHTGDGGDDAVPEQPNVTIKSDGTIVTVNQALLDRWGYADAASVVGKNVKTLMPEHYAAHHDGFLRKYQESGKSKLVGKGARRIDAMDSKGQMFSASIIVDRVAVPALSRANDDTFLYFDGSFELHDDENEAADAVGVISITLAGTVTSINPFGEMLFGVEAEDVVGSPVTQLMSDRAAKVFEAMFDSYRASSRDTMSGVERYVTGKHRSGRVFPMTTTFDVVNRGTEFEAVHMTVKPVNSEDTIALGTTSHGLVTSVDERVAATLGYSIAEVTGRNISMIMAPPHNRLHDSYLRRYRESGGGKYLKEPRIMSVVARHRDGSTFDMTLEVHETLTDDGDSQFLGRLSLQVPSEEDPFRLYAAALAGEQAAAIAEAQSSAADMLSHHTTASNHSHFSGLSRDMHAERAARRRRQKQRRMMSDRKRVDTVGKLSANVNIAMVILIVVAIFNTALMNAELEHYRHIIEQVTGGGLALTEAPVSAALIRNLALVAEGVYSTSYEDGLRTQIHHVAESFRTIHTRLFLGDEVYAEQLASSGEKYDAPKYGYLPIDESTPELFDLWTHNHLTVKEYMPQTNKVIERVDNMWNLGLEYSGVAMEISAMGMDTLANATYNSDWRFVHDNGQESVRLGMERSLMLFHDGQVSQVQRMQVISEITLGLSLLVLIGLVMCLFRPAFMMVQRERSQTMHLFFYIPPLVVRALAQQRIHFVDGDLGDNDDNNAAASKAAEAKAAAAAAAGGAAGKQGSAQRNSSKGPKINDLNLPDATRQGASRPRAPAAGSNGGAGARHGTALGALREEEDPGAEEDGATVAALAVPRPSPLAGGSKSQEELESAQMPQRSRFGLVRRRGKNQGAHASQGNGVSRSNSNSNLLSRTSSSASAVGEPQTVGVHERLLPSPLLARLKYRYIIALALMAVMFSVTFMISFLGAVDTLSEGSQLVFASMRLSEVNMVHLATREILIAKSAAEEQFYRDTLTKALSELEWTHNTLLFGNSSAGVLGARHSTQEQLNLLYSPQCLIALEERDQVHLVSVDRNLEDMVAGKASGGVETVEAASLTTPECPAEGTVDYTLLSLGLATAVRNMQRRSLAWLMTPSTDPEFHYHNEDLEFAFNTSYPHLHEGLSHSLLLYNLEAHQGVDSAAASYGSAFALSIVMIACVFAVLLRPMVQIVRSESEYSKALLLMIPDSVIESVPHISEFFEERGL